ncbi:hypothetical protein ANCDUO_15304 [Ancylostoma duodenale]|uniref:Cuticlin N-terminal domain-containing protein n=1 Tax=Ancylostoma duodenale TaxID=51022 RepID=A0A0C2CDZ7_9BILA|nr:hypothetical protein ANCDUO_15304 [Ancylostoma duodenale]
MKHLPFIVLTWITASASPRYSIENEIMGEPTGLISSLVVVVSFHGTFVTKADRAYKCICFFRSQKTLTNSIEMSPIGTTELLNTLATPTCTYSIHSQTPDGPIVMYICRIYVHSRCATAP